MTPPRRLRTEHLDRIVASLSERDRAIASEVAKLRLVCGHQLQRLFFVSGSAATNARLARHGLSRLVSLRVIGRLDRVIGGVRGGSRGHVYALDVAGQYALWREQASVRRRPFTPSAMFTRHTLAVAELYVRLTEAARAGSFDLIEFQAEPECWRDFPTMAGRNTLKPDAFLRIGRGEFEDLWFVEVDCATESRPALARKFRAYRQFWSSGEEQRRSDVFPRVLWLAPSVKRLEQIIDVAASQPAESWKLFGARLFDEAVERFRLEDAS